jgi:annexin A7/11
MMVVAARRAEDSAPVVPQAVEHDVTELQRGMGNMISKNASSVCDLLFTRNDAQIRAIVQSYQQRFHEPLTKAIKSKFSGHMEDALLLLIERAVNRAEAEAGRLEDSMAGLGTKDDLLVQRVVRCHWDQGFMRAVNDAYKRKYGKTLVKRIEGETRGDYVSGITSTSVGVTANPSSGEVDGRLRSVKCHYAQSFPLIYFLR